MKTLIVIYSYHHKNTEKIAHIMGKVLDADVKAPKNLTPEIVRTYDLIGFGSGIYSAKHHSILLEFVKNLPEIPNLNAFIFSTAALVGKEKMMSDHQQLKSVLERKGFVILDEFSCKGFNTNSFLKFFGGMNKNRPNAIDLKNAEIFAQNLRNSLEKKN
ncbi:hypothetical protein NEF87_003619 [Candidatus Lokiarchaeum ossiferum]|uniref:Flavodoxin domain-containing protein n=1 Tax=Candidatus Lokiarchaeum ossiferum TaxID=2951803 RepID=A0ABY6HUZ4_9ARCH|nr:hypothetical protein NEF87_003619 [Candidatus Lokiarchaeum sp. B-35]